MADQALAEFVEEKYGPEGIAFMDAPIRNGYWWLKGHHQRYAKAYRDELLRRMRELRPETIEEIYKIGRKLTEDLQNLP